MYVRPRPRFRPRNAGGVPFSPALLFTTGVAGAWYDPSDINNYMAGLGPELVTNGDFASGTTGWAVYPGLAPDTFEVVGGELHIANDGSTRGLSGTASAAGPSVVAGVTYKVTFTLRVVTASGNASVQLNANYFSISRLSLISNIASNYPVGTYEITRYYTATNTELLTFSIDSAVGAVSDLYFDNISVKQVTTIANATLFQDSAGTTPVTAVEQPVGLMLDKSQGLVLGSEATSGAWLNGHTTTFDTFTSTGPSSFTATTTGAKAPRVAVLASLPAAGWYWIEFTATFTGGSFSTVGVSNTGSPYSAAVATTVLPATGVAFRTLIYTSAAREYLTVTFNATGASTLSVTGVSVKSYAGNHARQATPTSCPVLRARYNLALQSETLSNAAWSNGNILNGTRSNGSVSVTTSEGYAYIQQIGTYVTTVDHTISFDVVCDQTINNVPIRVGGTANVYTLVNLVAGQTQRITLTGYRPVATYFEFGIDARNAVVPGGSDATGYVVTFNRVDLRLSGTSASMPAYQRIAAATDYATAGFLPYLYFVTDDSFGTNSIDFTATDKMSVCAGVTKLSDANDTIPLELSSNWNTNNGSFYVGAPDATLAWKYASGSRGTAASTTTLVAFTTSSTYNAPITNVLTATHDIAGNSSVLRLNAANIATATGVKGTGNFGNYPLYIGRRNNATLPFNGNVYGLIVCGKMLSASELSATESWMNARTGAY